MFFVLHWEKKPYDWLLPSLACLLGKKNQSDCCRKLKASLLAPIHFPHPKLREQQDGSLAPPFPSLKHVTWEGVGEGTALQPPPGLG